MEQPVIRMDEFITKYGVVVDGMAVTVSMEVTKTPAPYNPVKVGKSITCHFKGETKEFIPQACRDMVNVLLADLQVQLHEAAQAFYASPN
jgi:hypothetical protein